MRSVQLVQELGPNFFLIEVLGEFQIQRDYDFDNQEGILQFTENNNVYELTINGVEKIVGHKEKLKKPLLYCSKENGQIKMHKIIKEKIVFRDRPSQIFLDKKNKKICNQFSQFNPSNCYFFCTYYLSSSKSIWKLVKECLGSLDCFKSV